MFCVREFIGEFIGVGGTNTIYIDIKKETWLKKV